MRTTEGEKPDATREDRREPIVARAALLTPREREEQMRGEGSRRFVQRTHAA